MAPTDNQDPELIGKYEIQGVLGRGAMGVVYKGFDPKIERLVAIKTVRTDLLVGADGEDWLARFSREARAAGRCLHPNIVALFDYDQHEGMPFIAMEFVEGRELADLFKDGKTFSQEQALDVIRQVLSALDYAHASGIVHRDIKPANIIVVEDGSIKVTDFGIARLDTVNLTQHGSMIGTPSYMSPEQFTGKSVDHRSDLFSCGVLLFELLTGEKPFPGTTMTEIMYKVLHEHPRELSDVNHLAPRALNDVVRKALAKDPDERFQHAADFYNALEGALDGELPAAPEEPEEDQDLGATIVVSPRTPPRPSLSTTQGGPRLAPQEPTTGAPTAEPSAPAVPALDSTLIRTVEDDLAVYMGPIAKILVKKALAKSKSAEDLGQRLAGGIPDKRQSEEFLKRVRRTLGQPAPLAPADPGSPELSASGVTPPETEASGVASPPEEDSLAGASLPGTPLFSKDQLKLAERGLAEFLGPIARVMVSKAAKKSGSLDELYDRLAEHLNSDEERAAFRAGKPEA